MGPDEDDVFFFAALGQIGIFRQEPVAGMDGVHVVFLCDADDVIDVQVCFDRTFAAAYQVRFVRLVAVQGQCIFFRENGDGTDAQLGAGTEHADGDFATVCYEDGLDLLHMQNASFGVY